MFPNSGPLKNPHPCHLPFNFSCPIILFDQLIEGVVPFVGLVKVNIQNKLRAEAQTDQIFCCKLLRSNRPQAKFHFKSDSNRLLINFFDPKSLPDLMKIVPMIQIRTSQFKSKNNQNRSKQIKSNQLF